MCVCVVSSCRWKKIRHQLSPSQLVQAKKSWFQEAGKLQAWHVGSRVFPFLYQENDVFSPGHGTTVLILHNCTKLPKPQKKEQWLWAIEPRRKVNFLFFLAAPTKRSRKNHLRCHPSNGITAGPQTTESLQGVQVCSRQDFVFWLFPWEKNPADFNNNYNNNNNSNNNNNNKKKSKQHIANCKHQTTNHKRFSGVMLFVCLSAQLLPLKFTNSEFLEPPNPRFQLRFTEIEWVANAVVLKLIMIVEI